MSNEEANKVLEELHEVRPEMLNDKAKRLFEAIMKIADRKEEAEADLYEANNRINDLLDIVKQKDKIIDLMAQQIMFYDERLGFNNYTSEQDVKKSFEKKV